MSGLSQGVVATVTVIQIQRAASQGIKVFESGRLMGLAEYGAYGYEVRLGQRYGFSLEYMAYAKGQMGSYLPPKWAAKFSLSPSMAQKAQILEPRFGR
jgi:hypothetical protein